MKLYDINEAEDGFILRVEWEVKDENRFEDVTHVFSNDNGDHTIGLEKLIMFLRKEYET
jgi:hypothetical protein